MVAPDHDRCLELAAAHHGVEGQAGQVPLAQADPADACRQALEADALARHVQPAVQVRVVGEQLLHFGIGLANVLGVAAERDPAERPHTTAEQRTHIGGHKAGVVKSVGHPKIFRHLAQVVAIVHRGDAHGVKVEHGTDMGDAGFACGLRQLGVLRRVFARSQPACHAPAGWQVAVDDVVGRGLVGHDVRPWAAGLGAPHQLRQQLGRIATQANRHSLAGGGVPGNQCQGLVQVGGLLVEVAGAQPEIDAALLAFDIERAGAGKAGGQRLRAAHAAQACS